ncbi:hypothetical protein Dsin_010064 [Dipteronia sinensis]|uniref:Uncharacterized protein n=1 Tax=Dipteronia sinensis TaxID=43782 RepID=A0AAE0ASZ4_9ROSI|nr:hypothetical protein Dsin_010064 [Dipteronia sinensis]
MQTSWPTLACPSVNGSKFCSHEWDKHGTCSEYVLDQHAYFEAGLNLKDKIDLLQILKNSVKSLMTFKVAYILLGGSVLQNHFNKRMKIYYVTGIEPNGKSYSLCNITETIRGVVGFEV